MKTCALKFNENVTVRAGQSVTMKEAAKSFSELTELTENYDEGFYICDLGEVARLYHWWNEMFPRIRPFYAIKVGPYRPLLSVLAAVGGAFDSASKEETDLALECGATPDDIIFTHPHKRLSHIDHSRKNNIKTLVFDDECELNKLKVTYPDANLVLRIKTDDKNSLYPLSRKFGATMETSYELLKEAKHLDMNVIGVSFHVGCGCTDPTPFTTSLQKARQIFNFGSTIGMYFTVLDIGGGFMAGCPTEKSFEKMSLKINSDLNELFPIEQHKDLKIIAEPGRYFASTPFTLATSVISKKTQSRFPEVDVEYSLTEGRHGGFRIRSEDYPNEMIPFIIKNDKGTEDGGKNKRYAKLWGPTCDSGDVPFERVLVPDVEPGDWIFFENAGAYSFALNTNFNGFRTEVIHNIISEENEKIFWTLCAGKIQVLNDEQ